TAGDHGSRFGDLNVVRESIRDFLDHADGMGGVTDSRGAQLTWNAFWNAGDATKRAWLKHLAAQWVAYRAVVLARVGMLDFFDINDADRSLRFEADLEDQAGNRYHL